ncbi:MAG TPA: type II toxin-antitoxin system HicB family antitoxin [Longimicrobium sp.]|nr:type II toxin-antitoxin system HicB family antitoxin [Longimicrobium sp.]
MSRHEIAIFWSDEDQAFIAEVPELPGCHAHGETREEALANAQEAIDLWIEVARKRGSEIPAPRARQVA